ncbi:MAG: putative eSPTERase [Massilibacillus sp.]|jgi:acyl-CoA thioester hydrolase|nr:putative eSPTERase [Massilibacillus sp.]
MGQVRVKVNFFDTDAMAVVHHANYFRWFEIGRVEFLREAGITLNELIADHIVFPITDVSCKYRASARFDDVVIIETIAKVLTPVKLVFDYKVIREVDGELLAEGHSQGVFTSMETGKLIKLPKEYFDKLKAIQQ